MRTLATPEADAMPGKRPHSTKIKRRPALSAMLGLAVLVLVLPRAALADVAAKFHDADYGTDLVLIANVSNGQKQAALGITKDNNSPTMLFPGLSSWTQFVNLWARAKATPQGDTKVKIGTIVDPNSGNVMGIDVNKGGVFFFITDSSSTQLFVLKKSDQSLFDDDVDNVTLFLSH